MVINPIEILSDSFSTIYDQKSLVSGKYVTGNYIVNPTTMKICALAFRRNNRLTSINYTNCLSVIGDAAFSLCSSLTKVEIPTSVKYIGVAAFCASGLETVTFLGVPDFIEQSAFYCCEKLKTIFIPKGSKKIFVNMLPSLGDLFVELNSNLGEDCQATAEILQAQQENVKEVEMPVQAPASRVEPERKRWKQHTLDVLEQLYTQGYYAQEMAQMMNVTEEGLRYQLSHYLGYKNLFTAPTWLPRKQQTELKKKTEYKLWSELKVGDKLKHSHYGDGEIIQFGENQGLHTFMIKFEFGIVKKYQYSEEVIAKHFTIKATKD